MIRCFNYVDAGLNKKKTKQFYKVSFVYFKEKINI